LDTLRKSTVIDSLELREDMSYKINTK